MSLLDIIGTGLRIGGALFGGDGKEAGTTSTFQYPEEMRGLATNVGTSGSGLFGYGVPQWTGETLAPLSGATKAYNTSIANLANAGDPMAFQQAQQAALAGTGYQPTSGLSTMSPYSSAAAGGLAGFATGMGGYTPGIESGRFGDEQANFYMSPYVQQVLDAQEAAARRRFGEQQVARDAAAVNPGGYSAFGGSRRAVADALGQRDYNEQMDLMRKRGLQEAFGSAGDMWKADRDAYIRAKLGEGGLQMQAGGLTLGALQGLQGIGDQQSKLRLDAERARLAAEQQRMAAAGALGDMGRTQQQMELARLGALGDVGTTMDTRSQYALDRDISDYYRRMQYPLDTYLALSGSLPTSGSTSTTTQEAEPNMWVQAGGLLSGLSGYGEKQGWDWLPS
jgi:hypothetical protein